jgi:hypothetical protein
MMEVTMQQIIEVLERTIQWKEMLDLWKVCFDVISHNNLSWNNLN